MLVVEVAAVVCTVLTVLDPSPFGVVVTVWLWLTVLFSTFAEAVAEGRGKAQAATLRDTQQTTMARKVVGTADELRYTSNLSQLGERRGRLIQPARGRCRRRRGGHAHPR